MERREAATTLTAKAILSKPLKRIKAAGARPAKTGAFLRNEGWPRFLDTARSRLRVRLLEHLQGGEERALDGEAWRVAVATEEPQPVSAVKRQHLFERSEFAGVGDGGTGDRGGRASRHAEPANARSSEPSHWCV